MEEEKLKEFLTGIIKQVLQQELTGINNRLDVIEQELAPIKQELPGIKNRLDGIENDILELKNDILELKKRGDVIENDILELKKRGAAYPKMPKQASPETVSILRKRGYEIIKVLK